jgi:hypothetical protein
VLQLGDGRREIRILGGERLSGPELIERVRQAAGTEVDFAELTAGQQIAGGGGERKLKLLLGLLELSQCEQRTTERDASGMIFGVLAETGAAHPYGLLVLARPPVLLGELREYQGRGIALDPAPKLFEA